MKGKARQVLAAALALGALALALRTHWRRPIAGALQAMSGTKTVAERVAEFGGAARARLAPDFARAGVEYPPRRATLVGLKEERRLELWVAGRAGAWKHLKDYPILGASGTPGPKLRQGDRQVPEGLYRVESLNPNSLYHLALRVDYPNAEDRRRGAQDGRTDLGGDIMIHGGACSIGCLAMGDEAAEDLFVLAAETGIENLAIILSPVDLRCRSAPPPTAALPGWTGELYAAIEVELARLGKPLRR